MLAVLELLPSFRRQACVFFHRGGDVYSRQVEDVSSFGVGKGFHLPQGFQGHLFYLRFHHPNEGVRITNLEDTAHNRLQGRRGLR
jgi:hypothetical protein